MSPSAATHLRLVLKIRDLEDDHSAPAHVARLWRTVDEGHWTAAQIRMTAMLRSVNGATPANEFRTYDQVRADL